MAILIDDFIINTEDIQANLTRIVGQIFRLLPTREEGVDWIKPLDTIILELTGMASFFTDQTKFFALLCKLNGLKELGEEVDFMLFRRTIFEACGLTNEIKESVGLCQ